MRDNVESMKDAVEKHHLQTLHDILSHSSTLQRENEELKLKVKLLRQTNKSLADLCDELRGAFEGIGSTAS